MYSKLSYCPSIIAMFSKQTKKSILHKSCYVTKRQQKHFQTKKKNQQKTHNIKIIISVDGISVLLTLAKYFFVMKYVYTVLRYHQSARMLCEAETV